MYDDIVNFNDYFHHKVVQDIEKMAAAIFWSHQRTQILIK